MQSRNLTYDVVKGLGILLVIFAHFASHWQIEYVLFSFHMPLFILVAGLFDKGEAQIRDFGKRTRQNAWRLLVPYFGTLIYMCLISWIWDACTPTGRDRLGAETLNRLPLVRLAVSTGDFYATPYGEAWCGPLWFLFALFIARELFFLLRCGIKNPYVVLLVCTALSFTASVLYPLAAPMAWNPLPGIGMLIFYAIGWFAHQRRIPAIAKVLSIIAWMAVLYWYLWGGAAAHLDMRTCHANALEVLGACGGSLLLYGFCRYLLSALEEVQTWCNRQICKFSQFRPFGATRRCGLQAAHGEREVQPVKVRPGDRTSLIPPAPFWTWCGRNSMLILCVHSFDLVTNKFAFIMDWATGLSPWLATLDSAWLAILRAGITLLVALLIDLGLHAFYHLRDRLFPNNLEHVAQSI
ncbi:MAG: acyltransferase family protein [Paludibacteraceae bacterium]